MDPLKADECLFYILLFLSLCYKKIASTDLDILSILKAYFSYPRETPKRQK